MKIELTCPHCDRTGVILAIQDFHPDTIFCGNCQKEFDYIPTVWEHLDDLNEEVEATGMFYMIPTAHSRTLEKLKGAEGLGLTPLEWLHSLPLRYVVYAYKNRWRLGMPSEYGDNHNPPYDNIRLTYGSRWEEFPSKTIKDYLDTQPHVGPKGPEKTPVDRSSPTTRQGRMSYSQLRAVAERQGYVEWTKSKLPEALTWDRGCIWARTEKGTKHQIRSHPGVYFCREINPSRRWYV